MTIIAFTEWRQMGGFNPTRIIIQEVNGVDAYEVSTQISPQEGGVYRNKAHMFYDPAIAAAAFMARVNTHLKYGEPVPLDDGFQVVI